MIYYIYITIIIAFIFYFLIQLNRSKINREKITAYECGFEEFDEARNKYYIKYYLVALIFLIFDLETILLYPISIYITYLTEYGYYILIYIIFIISLGLAYEINKSILSH